MKLKNYLIILISFLCFGCSSDETKMTETEQYLANKYKAERTSVDFKTVQTKTNGKLTEDRKFISVQIKNPTDIEKLLVKGALVKGVLRCNGVWVANGKFGCTWRADQIRIKIPEGGLRDFAIMSDSEDEGDEPVKKEVKPTVIMEDSDSSDDEDSKEEVKEEEAKAEVSKEPEPPKEKPKKVRKVRVKKDDA